MSFHALFVRSVVYIALSAVALAGAEGAPREKAAAAAFARIIPVLRHPRCMNCHSTGDYPRQGDDSHIHSMQIRRGLDGNGLNAVRCDSCHQTRNLAGVHMPPGAPGWHLPPADMPMIWEGLTDGQLCELLKDPNRNGHKTIQQIVEHMETPLVLWGWHPGEGRTPVHMPFDEFLKNVKTWAAGGAVCPERVAQPLPKPETRKKDSVR